MKKIIVIGVIALFVGVSVSASTGKIDTSKTNINDGSLVGYVNDTSGNPIEGALVRVYFHGTYEEDYSDSTGFYHVTNIPICKCLKNATCSKDGYKTKWVLLGIVENTTHDFILTSDNQPPNPPKISGTNNGNVGEEYEFQFSAVDPEGQNVSFYVEWGDGTSDGWSYYVKSGHPIKYFHTWFKPDDYFLRCKAKDIYGKESVWTYRTIKISKNKACNFNFLGNEVSIDTYRGISNSITDNSKVIQEISVRIHRANRITPYTLRLTEKESDEVDRIFDNLKVSLNSAVTDEEIDEIFDDAVVSLYELGLFPKMTVEEAQQLINGKSVKSPSGNLGTANENFNCQISGKVIGCRQYGLGRLFRGYILLLFILYLLREGSVWKNFPYFMGRIEWMDFGSYYNWYFGEDYIPAEGWVWTNGTNGVIKWEGEFYGDIRYREYDDPRFPHEYEGFYTGVDEFNGVFIEQFLGPQRFLGNAEHVRLSFTPSWP